jgi:dihydrofolate synthase/folylpolyglutamate synthase
MAVELIRARLPVTEKALRAGVTGCALSGRQEVVPGSPETILDVAHNPGAAAALADTLHARPCPGQTRAVFGAYADKDIEGVARSLRGQVDAWYVAALPGPRGASCETVAAALERAGVPAAVSLHADVAGALTTARHESACRDRIVVLGSFETVRQALRLES